MFARVRPHDCVSDKLVLRPTQVEVAVATGRDSFSHPHEFRFAHVFGPDTTQADVFDGIAKKLVIGALDGVNCTIFAYGQTGSGKTYTTCGGRCSFDRGMIPRALCCIFDEIDQRPDIIYTVSMSMIEVYKELGFDLLGKEFGKTMDTWPTVSVSIQNGKVVLVGAKRVPISSQAEGLTQYFIGDAHRMVAETPHNMTSSRSHCVFTIFIEALDQSTHAVRTSKVQIVDLAGSERLKPFESGSQSSKVLMNEAVSINLSLHWLEAVISALNQGQSAGFVPYRNSFLTKVLQDALGGNARAVMVTTINPSELSLQETISSCRFAQRVANVRTKPRVNEESDSQLVIAGLKQENAELQAQLATAQGEQHLSPDELRRRVCAFLEAGPSQEANELVRSRRDMYAAFNIFRELFWVVSSGKPITGEVPRAGSEADAGAGGAPCLPTLLMRHQDMADQMRELQLKLEEKDGECRMLKEALEKRSSSPPSLTQSTLPVVYTTKTPQTDNPVMRVPSRNRPVSARLKGARTLSDLEGQCSQTPPGGSTIPERLGGGPELDSFTGWGQAYETLLRLERRASDAWQNEAQQIRSRHTLRDGLDKQDSVHTLHRQRAESSPRRRPEALGQEIQRTKEATRKVQAALDTLRGNLRSAETENLFSETSAPAEDLKGTRLDDRLDFDLQSKELRGEVEQRCTRALRSISCGGGFATPSQW